MRDSSSLKEIAESFLVWPSKTQKQQIKIMRSFKFKEIILSFLMSLKCKNLTLSSHCLTIIIKFFLEHYLSFTYQKHETKNKIVTLKLKTSDIMFKHLPWFIGYQNECSVFVYNNKMIGKVSEGRHFTKLTFPSIEGIAVSVTDFHNGAYKLCVKDLTLGQFKGNIGLFKTYIEFVPNVIRIFKIFEDAADKYRRTNIISLEKHKNGDLTNCTGHAYCVGYNPRNYFAKFQKFFIYKEKYKKIIYDHHQTVSEIATLQKFINFEIS